MRIDRATFIRWLVLAGWVGFVPLVGAFFYARLLPGQGPLIVAQVLFLLPVAGAAAATTAAYWVGSPGAERRVWGTLAIALCLLLVSESYYSWIQIAVNPGGPPAPSVYDLLNFFAAVAFLAAIRVPLGVSRLSKPARLRFDADLVAFVCVAYMGLYHFWVRGLAAGLTWVTPAWWTAYSVVGVVMLVGVGWTGWSARITPDSRRAGLIYASLAIYGVGMALWPLWRVSVEDVGGIGWVDSALGSTYLTGYYLLLMAALMRVADKDGSWRVTTGRPFDDDAVAASTVLSVVVFAAVALTGWWSYHVPQSGGEGNLYVAAATLATMALVARTGFSAVETGMLRDTATVDPVTGALNHRAFQERIEAQVALARRRIEPFTLAVLDVDGFARVNAALGHARGDLVLAETTRSLKAAAGKRGSVFRLSADEFAVVGAGVAESEAVAFGSRLLEAVRRIRPARGIRLSASVGVTACEGAACGRDEVMRRAETAQVWAKYHGKDRVVLHDERIVRALGIEDRMRLHEELSHLGMARAIATAADARDPRNYYHSRNVAALSLLLCEELGMDAESTSAVEVAAMLHDVGKIALPDRLVSPLSLSKRDKAAAEEHTVLGARLLESLGIDGVPDWVRHHHERWDGEGYPDRLKGDEIPLQARVIALADAYDGMTSGRSNGVAMSKAAALQEIDHGIGLRFDPELTERFILVVGATASLGWSDEWVGVGS